MYVCRCRGTFASCLGPLDAQCRLLDDMADVSFDSVDVGMAVNIVEAIACVVHRHIAADDKSAQCRSTTESNVSARCAAPVSFLLLRASEAGKEFRLLCSKEIVLDDLASNIRKLQLVRAVQQCLG